MMLIFCSSVFAIAIASLSPTPTDPLTKIREDYVHTKPLPSSPNFDGLLAFQSQGHDVYFKLKERLIMANELLLFTASRCHREQEPVKRGRFSTIGNFFSRFIPGTKPAASSGTNNVICSEMGDHIVKFVDNCSSTIKCKTTDSCDRSQLDPLVDEFVFAKFVSNNAKGLFVTADVIAISPPFLANQFSLEDATDPPKPLETKFLVDDLAACDKAQGRFIVENRVGESVAGLMGRFFRPLDKTFSGVEQVILATKIFIAGMNLLKRIHAENILHGDIHPGNIALLNFQTDALVQLKLWLVKDLKNAMVLIDFGKARLIEPPRSVPEDITGMNFGLLSPWHLQGAPLGARDDIFPMFEIYLNLLSNSGLALYYSNLPNKSAQEIARVKLEDDLVDKAEIISDAKSVTSDLSDILAAVRRVTNTASIYENLTQNAQTILNKFTGNTD